MTICCAISLLATGCASTRSSAEPTTSTSTTTAGADAASASDAADPSSAAADEEVAAYLAAPEIPQGVFLVDSKRRVGFRAILDDGGGGNFNDHLFIVAADQVVAHHTLIDRAEGYEYGAIPPAFEPTLEARRERAAAALSGFSVHHFEQAILEHEVDAGRAEVYAAAAGGDDERGERIHVLEEIGTGRPFLRCGADDGFERQAPQGVALYLEVYYSTELGLLFVNPDYPRLDICSDVETAAYVVRM